MIKQELQSKRILTLLISLALIVTLFPSGVLAEEPKAAPVQFKQNTENPPARSTWIGVLQGTWSEMGKEYGLRAAKDIATNFDIIWNDAIDGNGKDWQKKRPTKEEKAKYIVEYLTRSYKEVAKLSPEMIQLTQGVADGAASELDKSTAPYANTCPNFIKIAMISFGSIHYNAKIPKITGSDDCNGFWISGKATTTKETYGMGTSQDQLVGGSEARQVACVFMPKDPKARVVFYNRAAGEIAAGGNGIMNDLGVAVVMQGAQYADANKMPDETLAPGIKDFVLGFYAVTFSKSAREAVEKVTVGTPKYRKLSGRKTVLRARGANMLIMDPKEAFVVESNAKHYAVRKPGDLAEDSKDFIVSANHFNVAWGSFDENNKWNANEPMINYCPPRKGDSTYERYWSGIWTIKNNLAKIDRETVMTKLASSHDAYEITGNPVPADPVTGAPALKTFCPHYEPRSELYPLGGNGDAATSVYVLSSSEAYYVPAYPCTYNAKNWNHVDLKPYAEYRKLLWNIK